MAAKHKEIIFFKALLAPFQSIQGLNYQAIYHFYEQYFLENC